MREQKRRDIDIATLTGLHGRGTPMPADEQR
jgi:hypothetical protein